MPTPRHFRDCLTAMIGKGVTVGTTGRDVRGKLLVVGEDYLLVENPKGQHHIPMPSVAGVRCDG